MSAPDLAWGSGALADGLSTGSKGQPVAGASLLDGRVAYPSGARPAHRVVLAGLRRAADPARPVTDVPGRHGRQDAVQLVTATGGDAYPAALGVDRHHRVGVLAATPRQPLHHQPLPDGLSIGALSGRRLPDTAYSTDN